MPKAKRSAKAKPRRKEKRDFAQTAFSVFQKAAGAKFSSQRHSRSGRGK